MPIIFFTETVKKYWFTEMRIRMYVVLPAELY